MNRRVAVAVIVALGVLACGPLGTGAAPVPKGADRPPPPTAEQLAAAVEKLREIGQAFHNHLDINKFFPNNLYTAKGEPLLSWRVRILPYLEQEELYKEFRLDEPWDSPHNKTLIARMPKAYAPIRVKAKTGETFYRTFVGKATPFGPDKGSDGNGVRTGDIRAGCSNTGGVFEAGESVIWTKPDDLKFGAKQPLPKFGAPFDGEAHVVLFDGTVMRLKKDAPENELRIFFAPTAEVPRNWDTLRAD